MLNTGRQRQDEKTGNLLVRGNSNRRVVGQAMGRQQAGSRTGDGSATSG